eukprot:TRINITY_DN32662_c0_g1_i1.p1 TRINITY_DN32662_c0_g1~~TRINITY_DN32662_c0_g1_i1.p1  ORF type:complete len:299 (+),score=56.83 TRINITY_DN32662_c0_g1_i1:51-947(+)
MALAAKRGKPLALALLSCILASLVATLWPAGAAWASAPAAEQTNRRLLLTLAALAPSALAPRSVSAEEKDEYGEAIDSRTALYRGKAQFLRANAEWYRFYVGDLVARGAGIGAPDGMAADNGDCGGGLCSAGMALRDIGNVIQSGEGRGSVSALERRLITPMFTMCDLTVWDPDIVDQARDQAEVVRRRMNFDLRKVLRNNEGPAAVQKVYVQTLEDLNKFFKLANEGGGAKLSDAEYLPQLPLSQEVLANDEYWKVERKAYEEATDPVKQFQDRNALASKELRNGLKRFPGATLLLR